MTNFVQPLNYSNSYVDQLPLEQKKEYYAYLKFIIENMDPAAPDITTIQKVLAKLGPKLRNFEFDIRGVENIPENGSIIMCNHSNSHDTFNLIEVLTSLKKTATFLAETNGITSLERSLFRGANATLIDRNDKESSRDGLYDFTAKIASGHTGVIFGESTWNLHPLLLMHYLKLGGAKASAISERPIVPTIMEYVEVPDICSKEKDLYQKCIIEFQKPVEINPDESLIPQTRRIQTQMEQMRKKLWIETGTDRNSLEDINPERYINHTGLKVYGGAGIFDYEREKSCLYVPKGEEAEFMYTLDENGNFVSGELTKEQFRKTLKK